MNAGAHLSVRFFLSEVQDHGRTHRSAHAVIVLRTHVPRNTIAYSGELRLVHRPSPRKDIVERVIARSRVLPRTRESNVKASNDAVRFAHHIRRECVIEFVQESPKSRRR